MDLAIHKSPGLRNDLLIRIPRHELANTHLSIVNRAVFLQLPGLLRGYEEQDSEQRAAVGRLKRPVEEHLMELTSKGAGLVGDAGEPLRPTLAIGCRNLGNNRGLFAWQRDEIPHLFAIQGDGPRRAPTPMLAVGLNGELAVWDLVVSEDRILEADRDITGEVDWCLAANCVLRDSRPLALGEIADQFYDSAHLFAIDRNTEAGRGILTELYDGFSLRSSDEIVAVAHRRRLPRNRFLHNAIGLSAEEIIVLQREGTVEEIAHWLRHAGAKDGFILDNGGSVFCWSWWAGERGGYLFRAPDFRPPSSAILAFALHGPAGVNLPGGSISYSVV